MDIYEDLLQIANPADPSDPCADQPGTAGVSVDPVGVSEGAGGTRRVRFADGSLDVTADLGSPYRYEPGELPGSSTPREGSVLVSVVPNHTRALVEGVDVAALAEAPCVESALADYQVDWVRLWVCAPSPDPDVDGPVEAVVLLDREQAAALRDSLDAWLATDVVM